MELERNRDFSCTLAILSCFMVSVIYVASLYIWRSPFDRQHADTIRKRFISAFVMMFVSPLFLYLSIDKSTLEDATIWELLGLRSVGIVQAIVLPLLLTMILFLGPLCVQVFSGCLQFYIEPMYWVRNFNSLIWWRNQIVAPLSEEWSFRVCMLPLLLQCYSPTTAIFICPLFFGVAHFHHITAMRRSGLSIRNALTLCVFQFLYTTVFGAYAGFLFVKTGHYIAPVVAHAFCNHMGFPDPSEVLAYKHPLKRLLLFSLFVVGAVAWYFLLDPMTNPSLFSNELFWAENFD